MISMKDHQWPVMLYIKAIKCLIQYYIILIIINESNIIL